jgi:hypothetical protein
MARTNRSASQQREERANVIHTKRPEVYNAEYAGYLVCDILAKDEKALETYTPSWEALGIWQSEMVDTGFKVVTVFSKDGASVRAELHDMDKESDHAGWRLSSFADELYSALVILHYKQTVLLNGDWSLAQKERTKRRYG